jgi:hypothetical protein
MEYRVIKMSDRSTCDCCGKTYLKRTVHMENLATGQDVFYGVDCAASALRQRYQGKRYPVSREAVKSMAARAGRDRVVLESAQ